MDPPPLRRTCRSRPTHPRSAPLVFGLRLRVAYGTRVGSRRAEVAREAAGLLECVRGFRKERPEDVEVVGGDRVELEPGVDALLPGLVGEPMRISDEDIASAALNEHWWQPRQVGAERADQRVVDGMAGEVGLDEAVELIDGEGRLGSLDSSSRLSNVRSMPGQSSTAPPGSGSFSCLTVSRSERTSPAPPESPARVISYDADDAVQETLVRAWRAFDRFEGRASVRSWLYRIATNVCIDMLNGRQRRARPVDIACWPMTDASVGAPRADGGCMQAIPGGHASQSDGDPAESVVARDAVRLAVVAAMRHLPPRQRSVPILREVLRWRATEVAELLGTTVASVNGALQRARATLAASEGTVDESCPMDEEQRLILQRYTDAFERYDLDALVSLLR
jgi:RNA polymerase sigma factor (sigma-70 family)